MGLAATMTFEEAMREIKSRFATVAGGVIPAAAEVEAFQAICDEAIAEHASMAQRFEDLVATNLNLRADKAELVRAIAEISSISIASMSIYTQDYSLADAQAARGQVSQQRIRVDPADSEQGMAQAMLAAGTGSNDQKMATEVTEDTERN